MSSTRPSWLLDEVDLGTSSSASATTVAPASSPGSDTSPATSPGRGSSKRWASNARPRSATTCSTGKVGSSASRVTVAPSNACRPTASTCSRTAHGDLSAYNLLWWDDRLWFIDLPQAIDIAVNLQGIDFLHRDVLNVCGWFERRGFAVDAEEVFADVLGFL